MKKSIFYVVFVGLLLFCVGALAQVGNGDIVAWGWNTDGQCNVPTLPEGVTYIQVASGDLHSLALRSDGSLAAWGDNAYGQTNVPAGNDFIQVAGGSHHSLALRSDGSLVAWGDNYYGQCKVPAGNDFIQVAGGYAHSLALRSDGSLAAWGDNAYGQCNIPAGNNHIQVAGGGYHSLALRSDGSLTAWGQCNTPAGNDFAQVASGGFHSLALRSDGSLIAWGANFAGQCNVPAGSDFIQVAGGGIHSLALRSDGSLIAWGDNYDGQCNVPAGNDFTQVVGGCFHSLALISTVINVAIDIKPGNDANRINNDGHGVIPVAILGSAEFDVTQIDPETVMLEGLEIKAVGKKNKLLAHIEDVNNDGFDDLMAQFEDQEGAFTECSTIATVTGNLFNGTAFQGTDKICIVPQGLKKKNVISTNADIPESYDLLPNYPNPFNPETTITYNIPEQSHVILEIYNISGEKIASLVNGIHNSGYQSVGWDGRNSSGQPVAGGLYLCRLQAGEFQKTIPMLLLK